MRKKFELSSILLKLKEGKKAKDIASDLGISNSNLSYYLNKLKKEGLINYKGFGIWVVQNSIPTQFSQKKIRGHAFIWKIEFFKKINWKEHLDNSKIDYKIQSSGKVFRIFFLGKKIWLKENGLIVYEPYDFWGKNSYESKGKAVFNMDKTIKNIFFKLKLKEIPYKFTTSREHFAIVKNELARQYNENGEKMYIKSKDGDYWLWIDFSNGVNELETNNVDINKQVQDYWNDNKKHKFKVTPSFILEVLKEHNSQIGLVVNNQEIFDKNISLHQSVLEEIRDAIKELKEQVKKDK